MKMHLCEIAFFINGNPYIGSKRPQSISKFIKNFFGFSREFSFEFVPQAYLMLVAFPVIAHEDGL